MKNEKNYLIFIIILTLTIITITLSSCNNKTLINKIIAKNNHFKPTFVKIELTQEYTPLNNQHNNKTLFQPVYNKNITKIYITRYDYNNKSFNRKIITPDGTLLISGKNNTINSNFGNLKNIKINKKDYNKIFEKEKYLSVALKLLKKTKSNEITRISKDNKYIFKINLKGNEVYKILNSTLKYVIEDGFSDNSPFTSKEYSNEIKTFEVTIYTDKNNLLIDSIKIHILWKIKYNKTELNINKWSTIEYRNQ